MIQITKISGNTSIYVPLPFHEILSTSVNVKDDGHCGFRAIALAIFGEEKYWPKVRAHLLAHLRERSTLFLYLWGEPRFHEISAALDCFRFSAPLENWFTEPDMAVLAADLYRRPVVFLGQSFGFCMPLLPYRPQEFMTLPIVLVLKNGNHFHMGKLKSVQLLPVDPDWLHNLSKLPDLIPIYNRVIQAVKTWEVFRDWRIDLFEARAT